MPRWAWMLFLAVVLGAVSVAVGKISQPGVIDLGSGRRLRVHQVTVGERHVYSREHLVKRLLRRILPARGRQFLGPAREHRYESQHSSLVIWVSEYNQRAHEVRPTFTLPETVFKDGTSIRGSHAEDPQRQSRLAFNWFERDQEELEIRVRNESGEIIKFRVRNPAPIKRAQWTARPLPQTNQAGPVRVMLRQAEASSTLMLSVVDKPGTPHWTVWTITRFDDLGNWTVARGHSRIPAAGWPALPNSTSVVRMRAEGTDYISAGFIASPTNDQVAILKAGMAQEFGVRFLVFVGPGAYDISNGVVAVQPLSAVTKSSLQVTESGSNWHARLFTTFPGLFVMTSETNALSLRVRERLPNDRGRIFRAPLVLSAPGQKSTGLFHLPSLPLTTTNLEVELIIQLPPAEFYLEPTLLKPLPGVPLPVPKTDPRRDSLWQAQAAIAPTPAPQ